MTLRTFLITDFGETGCRMPFACAVTAWGEDDALELIRATYVAGRDFPRPRSIEKLDPQEIQNRIGNTDFGVPVVRGIWYPHLSNP